MKTEEDSRQLIMKRCMLRGTNVRYLKELTFIGVTCLIAAPKHQYFTWFITITEPWVSAALGFLGL